MHAIRSRKAFTLVELIIVIVILAILAGIAIVGYGAVVDRANKAKIEQAAQSFDREFRALLAFDGDESNGALLVEMVGDLPDGITVRTEAGTGVDGVELAPGVVVGDDDDAAEVLSTASVVHFSDGDNSACLTLALDATSPGSIDLADPATTCADALD